MLWGGDRREAGVCRPESDGQDQDIQERRESVDMVDIVEVMESVEWTVDG